MEKVVVVLRKHYSTITKCEDIALFNQSVSSPARKTKSLRDKFVMLNDIV